jgi:hypothetical protein
LIQKVPPNHGKSRSVTRTIHEIIAEPNYPRQKAPAVRWQRLRMTAIEPSPARPPHPRGPRVPGPSDRGSAPR